MKVVLAETLFAPAATQEDPLALHALFRFGSTRRHSFVLGFKRSSSIHFGTWLTSQPSAVQEAIQIALRHGQQSESREIIENIIHVEPRDEPQWTEGDVRLPVGTALELLSEPLRILVEDRESDGAFLKAVALGWHRDALRDLLEKGWVDFEHGGGLPSIRRRLENNAGTLARLRLRTWVVFDSDALVPEMPSVEARSLDEFCEKVGIKRHRLHRRAMENYIPPHELNEYWQRRGPLERKQAAGAFLRLDEKQRHHYCMKSGFAGDANRPGQGDTASRVEVDKLFSDPPLSAKDRSFLQQGFGLNIGEIFKADETRGRPYIPEERLRFDGQAKEMEPLFRSIFRWA